MDTPRTAAGSERCSAIHWRLQLLDTVLFENLIVQVQVWQRQPRGKAYAHACATARLAAVATGDF